MNGDTDAVLLAGLVWSLRVCLLLAAAWALTTALRRTTAGLRHRVWRTAMAAALAIPVVGSLTTWRWEVAPVVRRVTPFVLAPAAGSREIVGAAPVGGVPQARASAPPRGAASVWIGVWAAGTALSLGALLLGAVRGARICRRARRADDAAFLARVRALAGRVGLAAPVPVLRSSEITVPLTLGIARPRIVLPADAITGWPESRLEAVLLHELAHVRRRDLRAHVLGRVVCALHWFNPLAWAAASRMARECERACDDLVLNAGTRPSAYAAHLLAFVKSGGATGGPVAALGMARRSEMEGRIVALLDPATVRRPVSGRVGASVIGGVIGVGLLVALVGAGPTVPPRAVAIPEVVSSPPTIDRMIGEKLMALLGDADPSVRGAAARSAGERRIAAAVAGLSAALTDPVRAVREEAADALGEIGDPVAVEALGAVATRADEHEDVREAAIDALGDIGTAAAVARLGAALERTSSPELRGDLIEALGDTERPEAVAILGRLIETGDRRTQRRVLDALADIESDAALAVVFEQIESEDAELRRIAAQALGRTR